MEWIEFSDIIGFAIVVYVAVLAHNNSNMNREIKIGILFSGLALAILYTFDMSWYYMFYKFPVSSGTDFWLNFVTCIVYLMIPASLSTFFTLHYHNRRRIRHFVAIVSLISLAITDIINIFIPILFYHKDSQMYFLPPGLIMHILCFVAFIIILLDMIKALATDYEDSFLAAFVGITMFIGLLASWVSYDMKTLWVGMGISYLLMYLTISEMYNKKDVITDLPNRNAYEKAIAHSRKFQSIMMIDMNGLKKYNDTMGHSVGDQYIFATARTLADALDGHGKLYRVGGDEFCLVSPDSKEELTRIVEELLSHGKCSEQYGDFPIDFAYGIGVRESGDSARTVYNKADELMYEYKKEKHIHHLV